MCQQYYCQTGTNWHKLRKQIKFPIHIRLNFISRFVFFFLEANRTSRGFLFHNLTNYTYIPLSLIAKINWLIFVTALLMSKVLLTSKMALFFNDFYLLSYTVFHWVHKKIYEQEIFLFFSFFAMFYTKNTQGHYTRKWLSHRSRRWWRNRMCSKPRNVSETGIADRWRYWR
jgi:hypothetical protein